MKWLMLDFDGVINGGMHYEKWCEEHSLDFARNAPERLFFIVEECRARVLSIVEKTGCKVVWTSSWRHYCQRSRLVESIVKEVWTAFGFQEDMLYSWTPWLHIGRARHIEIEQWIDEHPEAVGRMVVLDDLPTAEVKDGYRDGLDVKLVQTSSFTGLTDENVDEAVRWLNEEGD